MKLILLYSGLLILGILVSQIFNLDSIRSTLTIITMVCLSYIMIEVGLEFTIDKKRLKSYGWDYLVAATAAAFPWIFCAVYFIWIFGIEWKEALLIGRFAAPTSAGVLFAMLAAAGLGATWLFRKAQVLAIFDDLDTVLLMIPLQMLFVGLKSELLIIVFLIVGMLVIAYFWLHQLRFPISKVWLLFYGFCVVLICAVVEHTIHLHLEVLLPAFTFGCLLYNPHHEKLSKSHAHEHAYIEPKKGADFFLDRFIKGLFMFLVGCSLPKIVFGEIQIWTLVWHVIMLTILSNLGKCFPIFCYRKEASLKHRLALSIAMFPRGEVGAGVLLIALGYGLKGPAVTASVLSLALNLLLTGLFIWAVIRLISNGKDKMILNGG